AVLLAQILNVNHRLMCLRCLEYLMCLRCCRAHVRHPEALGTPGTLHYTALMTTAAAALFLVLPVAVLAAQEEPKIPKDSSLVAINGCAKNGIFIVGERREDQPGTLEIQPGGRFRLNGPKGLLNEIKSHRRT